MARRGRPEPLDARLQVTAPHEWVLLAGLGLALLALVAWGVFGHVERSFSAEAVLVEPGERHAVISPAAGNVVEILAQVGDRVATGQTIARLQLPGTQRRAAAQRLIESLGADDGRAGNGSANEIRALLLAAVRDDPRGLDAAGPDTELVTSPHAGELVMHHLVVGQPVALGATVARIRIDDGNPPQALAFVSQRDAARLAIGMEAQVRVATYGREARSMFEAEVTEISAHPVTPPEWLSGFGLPIPSRPHLLRVSVSHTGPQPRVDDAASGSLRVILGRHSPLALLASHDGV